MTDQERKVMEMALEWLEWAERRKTAYSGLHLFDEAIEALRQALAQPEQEPVAWHSHNPDYPIQDGDWVEVIFTSGQPDDATKWIPLYAAPPSKPWVSLTDEDVFQIANKCRWSDTYHNDFARAIEAALKEKNT